MGIAYLLMLIVYIALAKGIYSIIVRPTTKVWIKRSVIAFFILFPTYDIIIGNALKFYYCQFTELEKINKMIERPRVVSLQNGQRFDKYEYAVSEARDYLEIVKAIQIKTKDDGVLHEFRAKQDMKQIELENVIEVNKTHIKKPEYVIIEESVVFPWFINKFMGGYGVKIIDTKTNEVIAWSKRIDHEQYKFDIFYGFRSKGCGGTSSGHQLLAEKSIKKDSK
ncbi:MAG: hypothetical protein WA080_05855 [Sulfuricurvum sp.]